MSDITEVFPFTGVPVGSSRNKNFLNVNAAKALSLMTNFGFN